MATPELDLLLINPGAAHGIYGELGDSLIAVEPPLWCRLIAGYVRDSHFTVKIIDAEAMQLDPAHVAFLAKELKPRLICLAVYGHQPSASTQQMHGASLTAKAIYNLDIGIPVIMVGGHVAALPERTLNEEQITYACNGEGPVTVAWLLDKDNALLSLGRCPGLVWRDIMKRVHNNEPAHLLDVDALHGDAWDLLPMDKYRAHNWQCFGDLSKRQPYASIYTSLGCPYKCSFCCINAPFQSNRYRMRDPRDVVDEILNLNSKYGVQVFKIVDEMFVLNERHYGAICEGLVASGIADRLNIWAYSRIDTVKPDKLKLLREAGIRWLALGIESGSAFVRDGASKKLKNDDIKGIVRQIQEAGINVIGNYIFGLPDDDADTMRATYDLAVELQTEFANFYSAMAYPGSALYTDALRTGATLPTSWRGYSQHNDDCRPLDTKHVGAATVLRIRDAAFDAYFTHPGYLAMVERRFGPETLEHVQGMTRYRLKRKLLEPEQASAE
jgi:radical SAM superfamily enzyme YgiQ (UPF0313 family)